MTGANAMYVTNAIRYFSFIIGLFDDGFNV
jgi:hypothetical protein